MSPETFRWSWIPGLDIQLTEWDDEIVIFNQLTQDTHLFNRPVDWILNNTRIESLSFNELTTLAIRDNIMTDDSDSREALNQTLHCLATLNFLESKLIDDADTLSA